jgi:hypothetical protein
LSTEVQEIYKLGLKKVEQAEKDKEWTISQSRKGVLNDEEFKEQLEKDRIAISLAKSELQNIYQDEINIDDMLSKAKQFIETFKLNLLFRIISDIDTSVLTENQPLCPRGESNLRPTA